MPSDFSKRVSSSSGDSPETGALKVRANDANNYIVGQISRSVFSEVRAAASSKVSRGFYDKIYMSFSTLHGKTAKAAKGADDLGDGIGKAEKGRRQAEERPRRRGGRQRQPQERHGPAAQGRGLPQEGLGQGRQGHPEAGRQGQRRRQ